MPLAGLPGNDTALWAIWHKGQKSRPWAAFGGCLGPQQGDGDGEGLAAAGTAGPVQAYFHGIAGLVLCQDIAAIGTAGDGPAINGGDDITDLGALTAYIAVLIDGHDAQTRRDAVIIGFIAAYFHHGDAQLCPTGHPAVLH